MRSQSESEAVEVIAQSLEREFAGVVTGDDLRREVFGVHERYRDARIRQFVPLLVYRDARGTLQRRRPTA